MKKAVVLGLLATAILAGCQSVGEVMPVGKDTYMIDATTRGGFQSHGETTALAADKARAFCAQTGKELVVGKVKTSGARGWTPVESDLVFQCVSKDDPEYKRPDLSTFNPK